MKHLFMFLTWWGNLKVNWHFKIYALKGRYVSYKFRSYLKARHRHFTLDAWSEMWLEQLGMFIFNEIKFQQRNNTNCFIKERVFFYNLINEYIDFWGEYLCEYTTSIEERNRLLNQISERGIGAINLELNRQESETFSDWHKKGKRLERLYDCKDEIVSEILKLGGEI